MANEYQIKMDFSKAKQHAQKLDEVADSLSRLAGTELQNTLEGLNNEWQGDNAVKYIQKGYIVKEDMDKTVKNLRKVADSIRTIAQNIYNAEMEALRIAREREVTAGQSSISPGAGNGSGGGGGHRF